MAKFLAFALALLIVPILLAAPPTIVHDPPPNPKVEVLGPGNHYFTAEWCNYCESQGVDIKILQDRGYEIKIYKQEEVPKIFKMLNIKKLPVTIVVTINDRGRKVYVRLVGEQPIRELIKALIPPDEEEE